MAITETHVHFTTCHRLVKATENQTMMSTDEDLRTALHCTQVHC